MQLMGVSISGKMTDSLPKLVAHTARALIGAISDPVMLCAGNGTVTATNKAMLVFLQKTGATDSTKIDGMSIFDVFPTNEEQLNKIISLCKSQSGIFPATLQMPDTANSSDQDRIPLQASMLQLNGNRPSHILMRFLTLNSVSKHRFEELNATLRNKNKQLLIEREMARKDAHTGVWQRATLFEELPRYIQTSKDQSTPTSFVVIDLDDFKEINDRYGHPCGDLVLSSVGGLLLKACRSKDKVARIGGEEFAMILPNTRISEAQRACQRIRHNIKETIINYDDQIISITASFGVTEIADGDDSEDVYKRADYALYSAKKAGRDKVVSVAAALDDINIDADDGLSND